MDDEHPALTLYVEYVPHDGANAADTGRSRIALTLPDGTGFTYLLTGMDRVLAHQLKDAQHLSVIYQRGTELRHAGISLVTMKVENDQLLVKLPGTT